jgi:hypothetical protein
MRGSGAVMLLRNAVGLSVFVLDRDFEVPVNPPPFARGACPFFCPCSAFYLVPYCTCTTELYSSTVQKEGADTNEQTNEPRTKFHLI